MPEKSVKNYIKFIEKFETKEVSLISYDDFDLNTTFDPNIMSNFFNSKLNASWKNHLIEGHKGKEIYLTN